MRYLLFVFILALFLSSASSYDLGIYPDELNFDLNVGEKVCSKLIVFSSENTSVELKDYWADNGYSGREIGKYNLRSELKGIEISYPAKFNFIGKKEARVCVQGNIAGKFHGLLMVQGGQIRAGSWMNVNVKPGIFSIAGNAVYDLGSGNVIGTMLFFTFILLLVLFYLIWKGSKIKRVSTY